FEALSYVWGSQEGLKQITCNNMSLSVTKNLFEALMALREGDDEDRYLWVDAICIDQNNPAEKAVQVRNMLTIYEKAVRVIAWLGP
ncbi:heterokaryon incompatibility, partial [Alternaria alternata]